MTRLVSLTEQNHRGQQSRVPAELSSLPEAKYEFKFQIKKKKKEPQYIYFKLLE